MVHKVDPGGPEAGGKVVEVGIWRDMCEAVDQGDAAASWLGAFLGMVSELNDQEGLIRNGKVTYCMSWRLLSSIGKVLGGNHCYVSFLEPFSHQCMSGRCTSREHARITFCTWKQTETTMSSRVIVTPTHGG